MPSPAAVIDARGALLRGPRGRVFGPLDAASTTPITVVNGARGSGRTSLLLSIAGRMRLTEGTLFTLGHDQRAEGKRVRRLTGIAGYNEIDALEGSVRVDDVLRERLAWAAPWYRFVRRPGEDAIRDALGEVFGPVPIPSATTLMREVSEAQDLLLRISLALIEKPRLVVVDDLDDVKNPDERREVAERVSALAASGIAFVVGSADDRDPLLFAGTDHTLLRLPR